MAYSNKVILAALVAYVLGSIPWGLLLTHAFGVGDIRRLGSGNVGATNVLRTGNKTLAALTLALDLGKGLSAVLIGSHWGSASAPGAAIAVVVGHMFPVWLGFRGGKGVATGFGVLLAIAWPLALVGAVVWAFTTLISHYSSLGSLLAAVASAVVAAFIADDARACVVAVIALLVIARHHENIRRLFTGTESRISVGKS